MEPNWKPVFRTPQPTVTRVLRSPAFLHARERSTAIIESHGELRALADRVETLSHSTAPLSTVADRISAAVRLLRARADVLEGVTEPAELASPAADVAARERLLVAGLLYLVTPVDLVPDSLPGGYYDDVILLAWVFGAAAHELAPYLADEPDPGG
jgi:uncharacterized membrane protein YkvA (DUF1232 family)